MNSKVIKKITKSDLFETLIHSKNYFLSNIATKAIAVISIPIFTRLFTQEDYGVVAVFDTYVKIFLVILSLNAHTAVGRYYYEKTDDFREFLGTTLILVGCILSATAPVVIIFYSHVAQLMQLPGLLPVYMVAVCLFSIIREIYVQILVPRKKSKLVAVITTTKGYSNVILAIVLVYLLRENRYLGRIWAALAVGFIFSAYFLFKMRNYSVLAFNKDHLRYIVCYAVPLIPYVLSGIILAQFDRIVINSTLGTASAGLYSLGYNIGMLLLMVISSTQTALIPDFYSFLENNEYRRLDLLVKRIFSIVVLAALGLHMFAQEIGIMLADQKFHPGLQVVPIVVIGYVFYGMFTVYNRYITYEKKTYYLSGIVLTAGILNIVLNVWLIPTYGYIAAAYTTLVSYFVMFILTWSIARRIFAPGVTPLWMIWKPTFIMFLFIGAAYILKIMAMTAILEFVIKLLLALFCGALLFWKEISTLLKTH